MVTRSRCYLGALIKICKSKTRSVIFFVKGDKYSSCLTNWAGFVIAHLDVFGITNTFFSTMFWFGIIAETLTNLYTPAAGKSARVPRWPWPPVTVDCGQQGETIIDFFLRSCCVLHLGAVGWPELTRARRLLTLLRLSTLSNTALASKLGGGGVTQTDTRDDTSTTGDRAGGPRRPVTPAAILLDWRP